MTTINPGIARLVAGAGGALLIASLFLPWVESGDATRTGWEALGGTDVLLLVTAVHAIAAALTGGRFGYFRPDASLNGVADILGVVTAVVVGAWLLFEVPSGVSSAAGSYLGLIAALVVACGAGDFRITSVFPRLESPPGRAS